MSTKRRMPASSGYIGAGNRSADINRKPKVAFEKINSLYDVENSQYGDYVTSTPELSDVERNLIKLKIRKQLKTERYWNLFYGVIALIITLALFYGVLKFVR